MTAEDEIAELKKHIETLEQRISFILGDQGRVLDDWNAQRIVLEAAVLQATYTFQTINENAQAPADIRALAAKGCERCDKAQEDAGYPPRPALSTDAAAKVVIRVEDSILERLAIKKARRTRIAEMQKGSAGRPQGRPSHPGTRIILRAMAYLEKTYGSEEKEAIELLSERATLPPEQQSGQDGEEEVVMMWDPYSTIQTPEQIADHCRRFKATFAEKMYAKIRCSFCTKVREEHSEAEVAACVEALRKNELRRSKRLEARKLLEEAYKLRPDYKPRPE